MKIFRLLLLSTLPLFTLTACPPKPAACDATTCGGGCCDSAGLCLVGASADACGTGGQLCTQCFPGQLCAQGLCRSTASGGGSGGGTGGGSGGGTAPLACSPGKTACSGSCVDTRSDARNCGNCGTLCNSNQFCSNSACTLLPTNCGTTGCPTGFFCTTGNQCAPGCSSNAGCPQPGTCDTRLNLCTCLTGFHACGQSCESDNNTAACGPSCANCEGIPNALPACTANRCDFTCVTGQHRCGDACKNSNDVATCGTRCTACIPPPNSTAICTNQACDFACFTGFHRCGNACVPDNSVDSCGQTACTSCTFPPNATATCNGFSCDFTCNAGFHRCGNACVSNSSVATCGQSCSPCFPPTNSSSTCDGISCGFTCNTGAHGCNGACVSNSSVSSCGQTSCTPCTPPFNGTSTCNGIACDFTCAFGTHRCSAVCSDNTSINACGSSCNPCPNGPANSARTCDGTTCGWQCNSGYHDCGGTCVLDSSVTQCGASCTSCALVANGVPTCNGFSCDFSCNVGFHRCGSQCLSNTSLNSCGSSCTACPTGPVNSTATCDGTSCGFICGGGNLFCRGECVPADFANACGSACSMCGATGTLDRPVCSAGTCGTACITSCSAACVDVNRDPANCGTCGTICGGGQSCASGECRASCATGPAFDGVLPYVTVSANATYKLLVEDLNGDGRADMVDNGSTVGLHVRYSNADGTFQAPLLVGLSSARASGFALVDLNNDGRKDIVATRVATTGGRVAVALNTGTGFSAATLLSTSTFIPTGVVLVADLNGDTRPDIIIPDTTLYLFYFVQSATPGVFPASYSTWSQNTLQNASYGDVADFNKDGRPDIVLATTTQYQVSINNGTSVTASPTLVWSNTSGTPQTTTNAVPLSTIAGVRAADLNGDTNPDVLLRAAGAGHSALGTGTGTFGTGTTFTFPGSSPILPVDLNADGMLDLVSGGSSLVYLSLATAQGVWPAPTSRLLNAPGTVQTVVATGQLVGSTAPEIFSAPQSSVSVQVSILVNEGAGLFPGARVSGSSTTNATAATGDVDGDGDRDLVVCPAIGTGGAGTGSILLGSNNGSFGSSVSTVPLRGDELALGRLNADAFADLVASIESSSLPGVDVFLGGAGGTFASPVRLATTGLPTRVLIANIDGDANADVVVGTNTGVEWFRGNGDGTFAAARVAMAGQGVVQALATSDLNMDGRVDLLVNSGTSTASLKVLLGFGMGAFSLTPFASAATSLTATDVVSVDFDRDGRPDVAVGTASGVLLFKVDGSLLLQQQTTQTSMVGRLAVADLDNDGFQDLVSNNGEVLVARGQGTGFAFLPARPFVPGRTLAPGLLLVDKLNSDSFRDVLVLSTNTEIWAYLGICR